MRILLLFLLFIALDANAKQPLPPLHHPVGIRFPAGMTAPSSFPLGRQKELICDSCHGIKNLDQIPLSKVNQQARNFLRNGPYPTLLDFCGNCHKSTRKQNQKGKTRTNKQAQTMQRFNLHQMLDKQGRIKEKNCTYCHVNTPDPDKVTDWHKLRFQRPPEKLCLGCHLKTTHLNAVQHQVKPSQKVLAQLRQTEKQKHLILPLDRQGKMMCTTCHSPHQDGMIRGRKQVAQNTIASGIQYGRANHWSKVFAADKKQRWQKIAKPNGKLAMPQYRPVQKEILLRLPAKNGQLCQACHRFKD